MQRYHVERACATIPWAAALDMVYMRDNSRQRTAAKLLASRGSLDKVYMREHGRHHRQVLGAKQLPDMAHMRKHGSQHSTVKFLAS